jgi:hypothetical protein
MIFLNIMRDSFLRNPELAEKHEMMMNEFSKPFELSIKIFFLYPFIMINIIYRILTCAFR